MQTSGCSALQRYKLALSRRRALAGCEVLASVQPACCRRISTCRNQPLAALENEVQRTPLNLNSIVQEVIVLVRTELRRNNITVRANLEENLQPIPCDRVQMQQVLLNLVVNAIEAMVVAGTTFQFRLPFSGMRAE